MKEQGSESKPIQMAEIFLELLRKLCQRQLEKQDKEQESIGKPSDLAENPLNTTSPQPHINKQEKQEKEQVQEQNIGVCIQEYKIQKI